MEALRTDPKSAGVLTLGKCGERVGNDHSANQTHYAPAMPAITGLQRLVERIGIWLASIPAWAFALTVGVVFLAKVAIDWQINVIHSAANPTEGSASFDASNFLGIAIFRLLNYSTVLYALVAIGALALAVLSLWRLGGGSQTDRLESRTLMMWALAWPLLLGDLAWLGNGFEFLPLFIVLSVLARRWSVVVAGAVLASLTHPEQALVAFASLLVLSLAPEFRSYRLRASIGSVAALTATVITSLWLAARGTESRAEFFFEWFIDAAAQFAGNTVLLVYSGWGVWWLLLLLAFGLLGRRGKTVIIISAILIPTAVTATTLDGTRVFVGVASAVGVALYAFLARSLQGSPDMTHAVNEHGRALLGISFLAFLILPNLQIVIWGDLASPHRIWLDIARAVIAG